MAGDEDPSGHLVYPKMQVPQQRPSEPPRVRGFAKPSGGGEISKKKLAAWIGGALVVGGAGGYFAHPSHAGEVEKAQTALADAKKSEAALDQKLQALQQDKDADDKQLADLAAKAADVDKRASELDAEQKKLSGALDKESGSVSTEGDEIHLKLVDKVLFATGDDQLSDKGKQVLDKVAAALKDIPDKQIWVQGHTDDQPIYLKKEKDKPEPKGKKGKKGAKDAKDEPEKLPEFLRYMTNWELSAARALEVVHYLQDTAKIDPTRLAALAFGQYRPVSRSNKALNRRIEIVLYPKKAILQKAEPAPAAPAAAGSGSQGKR